MDLPTLDNVISKSDVEKVILRWCEGRLSNTDFYEWVNGNYFPLSKEIDPNEEAHTQLALNLVLNEFGCTQPDGYRREGATAAIDFINTTRLDFRVKLERFLTNCFATTPSSAELNRILDRHRSILSDH